MTIKSQKPNLSFRWLASGLMIMGVFGLAVPLSYLHPWDDVLPFVATLLFLKSWASLAGIVELLPKEDQIRIGFALPEDFES